MNGKKIFHAALFSLFAIFLSIYGASKAGYYEYENKKEAKFTEKSMKKFEEDIAKGKNVNIKDYLKVDTKNYDNKITNIGDTLSNVVSDGIVSTLEKSFEIIEKLVE